ncbi:MAG: hypothetical protein OEZ22_12840 [Spirochaetia bacterium]|nr:hypothetical protein [Spirochaetia bacterium]
MKKERTINLNRRYLNTFLLFLFLFKPLWAEENKNEDLVSVILIQFEDRTNTQQFNYMPSSLSEAIENSLDKKFEYQKLDKEKIKIIFDNKKTGEFSEIKEGTKDLKTDIAVYGYFDFNEAENKISIKPKMYFSSIEELAALPDVNNTVDNTIFQATEKVADSIVDEISRMVLVHHEKRGKTQSIDTINNNEKLKMTKASLETRSEFWALGFMTRIVIVPTRNSAMFLELYGEKYFNTYFSGYGSFGYGFDTSYNSNYKVRAEQQTRQTTTTDFNGNEFPSMEVVDVDLHYKKSQYIKIPSMSLIAILGLLGGAGGVFELGSALLMDGIAFHIKPSPGFDISPFLGFFIGVPLDFESSNDIYAVITTAPVFMIGPEAGLRLHMQTSIRSQLSLFFSYFKQLHHPSDDGNSYQAGLSFSYLTGK